jgi:hypothetical protein
MATPTLSNLIEAELHARQLLIEKGVPSPLADEVIQLIRAESSKEEDADATQTRLQKISQDLASPNSWCIGRPWLDRQSSEGIL